MAGGGVKCLADPAVCHTSDMSFGIACKKNVKRMRERVPLARFCLNMPVPHWSSQMPLLLGCSRSLPCPGPVRAANLDAAGMMQVGHSRPFKTTEQLQNK